MPFCPWLSHSLYLFIGYCLFEERVCEGEREGREGRMAHVYRQTVVVNEKKKKKSCDAHATRLLSVFALFTLNT